MQQRQLGPDGPLVGSIGVGTHPLASYPQRTTPDEAVRVLVRAAELGVTFWDTADAYCLDDTEVGYGERLCGKAADALPLDLRERVVIATKGGAIRPEGHWELDGSPHHLREAIDASLRALQTECIDLYQFHRPDDKVPFADSVGALAEAKQQGKIRLVGISNVTVSQIDEAMQIVPIASVQNSYGFTDRSPEQDGTLQKCRELGVAFLPYGSFGGINGAKGLGQSGALAEIAQELGVSPQQIVLSWQLQKYECLVPIPGFTRLATLEDTVQAAALSLSEEQVARLDEVKVV